MSQPQKNYAQLLQQLDPDSRDCLLPVTRDLIRGRHDPVFFGEHFLGVRFHPIQMVWLWLTTRTKMKEAYQLALAIGLPLPPWEMICDHPFLKNILCPANRFGKTFVTAIKHIWYNFYKIGATGPPDFIHAIRYGTLNLSPHSLQVDAAYRYIIDIFDEKFIYQWEGKMVRNQLRDPLKKFLIDSKATKREVVFYNNSKIKGAPTGEDQASSIAGTDWFYVSYDEAPQSRHLKAELPAKIQSRLIDSGGPLDLLGTPEVDKPSHVYYQRIVKLGLKLKKGFFTVGGGLKDNIFLDPEKKAKSLLSIKQTDPEKYRQVAFGEFVSSGAKMFDTLAIERLWNDELPLDRGIPGREYMIGVDWGFADTGDPTVFYVIDYTEVRKHKCTDDENVVYYKVVFRESIKGGDPYVVLARLKLLQQDFNHAKIIHDSTSMGGVIIKKMLRATKVRNLIDFAFAKGKKDDMLFLLMVALNFGRRIERTEDLKVIEKNPNFGKVRSILISDLEDQLGVYTRKDEKLENDEVMAIGLPIWYLEHKYAGNKTKVFNINVFAQKPEQVISIPGQKKGVIPAKSFNIKTKIIG